jgi:hypothetical protein
MMSRTWWQVPATAAGVLVAALACSSDARAQGCMATRVSPPMFGASGEGRYLQSGQWEASLVGRHYSAKRHFYDSNVESFSPAPAVRRSVLDASLTRMFDARHSLSLSVPFSTGEFDRTPMAGIRPIYVGTIDKASGIGDIAVVGRRWMLDPATHGKGNYRLALGVKAPTGAYKKETERPFNGVPTRGEADIAIQPGDGGWGVVLGIEGFRHVGERTALFGEASYILNPRADNDHNNQMLGPGPYVPNTRSSVPDYYLVRSGISVSGPLGWKRGSAQIGLRLEGQPVRDILGSDAGFRRPGRSLAIEPGLAHSFGKASLYVSVPVTLYRGRPLSVDEEKRANQNAAASNPPGQKTNAVSAAFADVNVLVGFSFRLN